jgi:hypothetical protein
MPEVLLSHEHCVVRMELTAVHVHVDDHGHVRIHVHELSARRIVS